MHVGVSGMAEIYNLAEYRKQKELEKRGPENGPVWPERKFGPPAKLRDGRPGTAKGDRVF